MDTDISSGVVVQYSLSFGYVLASFLLYRRALNSDCPLLTFPTNSWTDVMLTGNPFMFKFEMLYVYMLSMWQLVWWSLWTSCGWSHTNCRATCSPSSICLFSVSAAPWVGASVGSSLQAEVISGVRERIIGYILYLKFLECEGKFEVRKIVVCLMMSVHMEQIRPRCADINDILHRAVSLKSGAGIDLWS